MRENATADLMSEAMQFRIEITEVVRRPWVDAPLVRRVARACLAREGKSVAGRAMSLVLIGDRRMRSLNRRTFGRAGGTDVIAFPLVAGAHHRAPRAPLCREMLLGEVFVSVDRAAAEAARRGIPLLHELLLYVAHGVLHLLGHDDTTVGKTRRMRAAERAVLARVLGADSVEALTAP